jgi:hypothetical protein
VRSRWTIASAQAHGATLSTCDLRFAGLRGVTLVEKIVD